MQSHLKIHNDITKSEYIIRKLMKEHHLQSKVRRKKPKYIKQGKEAITAPNILNRDFNTDKPKQKLATDITYIPIPNSMVYVSTILDLNNNEILEYKVSNKPDKSLSIDVVNKLIKNHNVNGSILHSDQGIHYTNHDYHNLLKHNGIIQSMSRKGNCWDNAPIESFFGHFKCECVKIRKKAIKSLSDVEEIVNEYIDFYNNKRPHSRLKGLSPILYRVALEK